jgi:hypothetical protein
MACLWRVTEQMVCRAHIGRTSKLRGIALVSRKMSKVSRMLLFLATSPDILEECVGHQDQHDVVIPASPRTNFEVIQTEFVLEFSIAMFDPPSIFGRGNQLFEACTRRKIAEEIFSGLCFAFWSFGE